VSRAPSLSPAPALHALDWIDRHAAGLIAAIGAVCALAFAASLLVFPKPDGRVVVGDAVHYFVYLRSMVFDHDLQFKNEYMRLYGVSSPGPETGWIFTPLPTGYVRNMMPIGSAIAWAPLYLVTAAGSWLLAALGIGGPVDGFSRPFQASAGLSGVLAATIGAGLAFGAARSWFGTRAAFWATLAVWLGSSALYYSVVSPTYSHATSMCATSAVIYAWRRWTGEMTVGRYTGLGLLTGMAALVRWQDAVFVIAPLADILGEASRGGGRLSERWVRAAVQGAALGGAMLVAFLPQMVVWNTIYGDPFLVPQGSAFMRWGAPHLLDVLFSGFRGLFTWTPALAFAVAGLWPLCGRERRAGLALLGILVASWYVNAAAADWWAGEAFGARRFVSCYPVFVLGAAALLERLEHRPLAVAGVVAGLVAMNLLLILQYQLFLKGWRHLAPYPDGWWNLWVARWLVPVRLVRWLAGG